MTYRAWNTKTVDRAALKELTAAIAQQNTEELEYQNMDEEWSEEKYRSVLAVQQKEAGLLAGILAARGITDPAEALTLTIPALLRGRWLFCIVPFASKAEAVCHTVCGAVSERCPASILRREEHAQLFLTEESARLLPADCR